MAQNFHIAGATEDLVDPQKNNLWTVEFFEPRCLKNHSLWGGLVGDKLKFRAHSITVPDRGITTTKSDFLGHQITFPLPNDDGQKSVDVSFVEREDMSITTIFNSWMHEIFDTSTLMNSWYGTYGHFKKDFVADIKIEMYGLNGEKLPNFVLLKQAFPTKLSSVSLSYGHPGAVEYNVSFAFDWWELNGGERRTDALTFD